MTQGRPLPSSPNSQVEPGSERSAMAPAHPGADLPAVASGGEGA